MIYSLSLSGYNDTRVPHVLYITHTLGAHLLKDIDLNTKTLFYNISETVSKLIFFSLQKYKKPNSNEQ